MVNRLLVACLAFFAISAQALPVTFSSLQFNADAVAFSDGLPDAQSASSTSDLVDASAASIGIDVATAGAIAGPGLLSTSADVSSVSGGIVSAVATSYFLGSFATSGQVLLGIDVMFSDFMSDTGSASSTLFVTLMNGSDTVFSDFLTSSRLFNYIATPGAIGTLELTLTSDANAGFLSAGVGGASSFGMVGISTPVPEPETCLMLLAGLVAIRLVVKRKA